MENNEKHIEDELENNTNTTEEEIIGEVEAEEVLEDEITEDETTTDEAATEETTNTTPNLEQELSDMKDKYLRIFAEFDNYRKRTVKEKMDIIKLASKDVINAMLPAVDDFSRAIRLDEEANTEERIPEGIVHVYNKLMKGLEQQGVRLMNSTGADFDPEMHEALTKIPAPTPELKGKVIDTIEQGYYLNDKIIRYAKVVVGE